MIVVLYPYCPSDEGLAAKNAAWIMSLKNDTPLRIVLIRDSRCEIHKWFGENTIGSVTVKDRRNEWPQSPNTMFSEGARYMEYTMPEEKSWLWLEPDAIPTGDYWLDKLVEVRNKGKKPFTGAYVPGAPGQDHLSGIAVYPNPLVLFSGVMLLVDNEPVPFDVVDGPNVVRQSHFTDLIQNRPRKAVRQGDRWVKVDEEQRFHSLEDFYKVATKECVLFHSDKNGDLIDILRSRHGDNGVEKPSVPELARLSTDKSPKPATQTKLEKLRANAAKARAAKAEKKAMKAGITIGSETDTSRSILSPYCKGLGMDMGYGGKKIVQTAWAFDMPTPYTKVGDDQQQIRGSCENLSFICDGALDYLYSSHLLEDFTYFHLSNVILPEWRRVLRTGGLLVVNCPDQQRFLAHCQKTGQPMNAAHKEQDFSLRTFKNVLGESGAWSTVFEEPKHGAYSFLLVVKKV